MTGTLRGALCAAVLSVTGTGAARADIMVDDFTQSIGPVWPQVQNVSTSGGASETEAGLSGVLGGVRGYVVKSAALTIPGLDSLSSNVFHAGPFSLFDYQSSVGASGTVELFYGDNVANPLDAAGVTGVTINFLSDDQADAQPVLVKVTLTSRVSPGVWATSSATVLDLSCGGEQRDCDGVCAVAGDGGCDPGGFCVTGGGGFPCGFNFAGDRAGAGVAGDDRGWGDDVAAAASLR